MTIVPVVPRSVASPPRRAPLDLIELSAILSESSSALTGAASTVTAAIYLRDEPLGEAFASARGAARRVLAALAAYERAPAGIELLTVPVVRATGRRGRGFPAGGR